MPASTAGEITAAEAPLLVRSLLSAGIDTTVNGIGAAIYCLARFPDQLARLRADPSLARNAFEEAVRFESPVQTFFRTTTREVEIGGHRIGEGEKVLMFLGSANRDPRRWKTPKATTSRAAPRGMSATAPASTCASGSWSHASKAR